MSIITKYEIRNMIERGNPKTYSHVIICLDQFSYEYYPRFVKREEDVKQIIASIRHKNMTSIVEVYNYDMNLEMQINEKRAYHIENLDSALIFATEKHKGVFRKTGEEYINHPMRVARYVEEFKTSSHLDVLKKAAYLHDTIEDTDTTYYELVKKFGPLVASLVSELTTDEDMKNLIGKTKYLEIKMKNMSSWALVRKLCDRLDNVSDLGIVDTKFRERYTKETLEIMEYLVQNRKLSKTHMKIMQRIMKNLSKIIDIQSINLIKQLL